MYEDEETLVAAGDCVHERPGFATILFDYSPDMEYLEVVAARFSTSGSTTQYGRRPRLLWPGA